MVKEKINVRGTLAGMKPGDVLILRGVRGSSLRSTATVLQEVGKRYQVLKQADNDYIVTCVK